MSKLSISSALEIYEAERNLIGYLVIGYGELEYCLCRLMGAAIGDDDASFRAFFRIRGEDNRISLADSFIRSRCSETAVKDHYAVTLDAMRHCKNIRNQFAHAHFSIHLTAASAITADTLRNPPADGLRYISMEDGAKDTTDPIILEFRKITVDLLRKQQAYFGWTREALYFLDQELRKLNGESLETAWRRYPVPEKPQLYIALGGARPTKQEIVSALNRKKPK